MGVYGSNVVANHSNIVEDPNTVADHSVRAYRRRMKKNRRKWAESRRREKMYEIGIGR